MHDGVHHGVQERDVGVGLELEGKRRVARELGAAGIGIDQLRPALRGVLDPGGRDRVIRYRVRADEKDDFGAGNIVHLIRYRGRADALEQRRNRGRVAQPRAVIHVVRAEARAHQFLEQVRLLVRALGRAEACERASPVLVPDRLQLAGG